MRRFPTFLLCALALATAACDDGTDPTAGREPGPDPIVTGGGIWAGNVAVTAEPQAVVLGNNTTRPVGYAVFGREWATTALWAPCVQRSCPTLAPGERKTVRAADVPGVDAQRRDVTVYWWHLVEQRDGTLAPDSVRAVAARVGG